MRALGVASRCSRVDASRHRVCADTSSRKMRKAIIGGAICRFSTSHVTHQPKPHFMLHHSPSRFDSARQASFGAHAASWSTPAGELGGDVCPAMIVADSISNRGRIEQDSDRDHRDIVSMTNEGKQSAPGYRPLETVSRNGADSDRGGHTQ